MGNMSNPKITARNSRYLRAIKALFNEKIYAQCLTRMNAEHPEGMTANQHVETYLRGTLNGDTSEEGIIATLAKLGRTVK